MKVKNAYRVYAPSLSKRSVTHWLVKGCTPGWYKEDNDFSKKKEYMSILVNAHLIEHEDSECYRLKKGRPYEG